jgi:hypothetical protein
MDEEHFEQYLSFHRRIKELQHYWPNVNVGSLQKLLDAQQQVLVECAAEAIKRGNEDVSELPEVVHVIPDGFIKCTGPCERVLEAAPKNFRLDSRLKSGFRSKCKQCSSVKGQKKKRRLEEEEFLLHRDGFQVYKGAFAIEPGMVELLKEYSASKWTDTLFNNEAVDDERNDKKRRQVFFSAIEARDRRLAEFRSGLQAKVDSMFEKRRSQDWVVLRSEPGCLAQRSHTDYLPKNVAHLSDDDMPLACVIACMDQTYFDVWPGAIRCFDEVAGKVFHHKRVMLNAGDMLVFRGDLVHGGAAFDLLNVRVHAYLDLRKVKRERNVTHYMDAEEGRGDVVGRNVK